MKQFTTILLATALCLQPLGSAVFFAGTDGSAPTPAILWWKVQDSTTLTGDAPGVDDYGSHDADRLARNGGFELDFIPANSDLAGTGTTIVFGTAEITICFRCYRESTSTEVMVQSSSDWTANNNSLIVNHDATKLYAGWRGNTAGLTYGSTVLPSASTYVHVAVLLNKSTGNIAIYYDGVSQTVTAEDTSAVGTDNFATYTVYVGAKNVGVQTFDGRLDSIEIHSGNVTSSLTAIINRPAADQ